MTNKLYKSAAGLFILLMVASCQKEAEVELDVSPPAINIVQPAATTTWEAGQEVGLYVELSENQDLHDYSIVLRSEDRTYAKTILEGHSHGTSFVVDMSLLLPKDRNQVYTLTVKASDHNGNLASERVELWVE